MCFPISTGTRADREIDAFTTLFLCSKTGQWSSTPATEIQVGSGVRIECGRLVMTISLNIDGVFLIVFSIA